MEEKAERKSRIKLNCHSGCFYSVKGDYHLKKLFLHRTRYQSETLHLYRFWHAEHESEEIFWVWLFVSMETVKQWDFGSCLGERPILQPAKI